MPLPWPALTVTKLAVVFANQVQPEPAVTLTVPVPPAAGKLVAVTEAEYEQGGWVVGGAAAAWIPVVSGDVPPQSFTWLPGDQFSAVLVSGPE